MRAAASRVELSSHCALPHNQRTHKSKPRSRGLDNRGSRSCFVGRSGYCTPPPAISNGRATICR